MRVRAHGKYAKQRKDSPRAIATCDYSGLIVRHADLVKQYEYRGRGLVWTGFWVHPKFLDKPNPQNLTPLIKMDPVPILFPRPDNIIDAQTTIATSIGEISIDVSGSSNITLTQEQYNNGKFNFFGAISANIIIYIPNVFNQFYANNTTTGAFTIYMLPEGSVAPGVLLPRDTNILIANTMTSIQRIF